MDESGPAPRGFVPRASRFALRRRMRTRMIPATASDPAEMCAGLPAFDDPAAGTHRRRDDSQRDNRGPSRPPRRDSQPWRAGCALRRAGLPSASRFRRQPAQQGCLPAMKALNDPAWGLGWPVSALQLSRRGSQPGCARRRGGSRRCSGRHGLAGERVPSSAGCGGIQLWRGDGADAPVAAPTTARRDVRALVALGLPHR